MIVVTWKYAVESGTGENSPQADLERGALMSRDGASSWTTGRCKLDLCLRALPIPACLLYTSILRYSRHLIMPEVGMEGQRKLKACLLYTSRCV